MTGYAVTAEGLDMLALLLDEPNHPQVKALIADMRENAGSTGTDEEIRQRIIACLRGSPAKNKA